MANLVDRVEDVGRSPAFLDGVADLDLWYLAEVPLNTQVWEERPQTTLPEWSGQGRPPTRERLVTGEPAPVRVDALAAQLPQEAWQPYVLKEGSKGPLVAEFAFRRVVAVRDGLPGPTVWLVFRRSLDTGPKLKAYLSNAPEETPQSAFVRVAGMRWPIETAIEECKGGLGMDHYEVRSWLGWHHHMTMCLLAHHFLNLPSSAAKGPHPAPSQKKAPALTFQQARLLLASVLPLKRLTAREAIRRIRFVQKQNHAAYLSHRKRILKVLDDL